MRINDNKLDGNFTKFHTLGNLRNLITLDLYNNVMEGDVPPAIRDALARVTLTLCFWSTPGVDPAPICVDLRPAYF